nr:unnamed protein product [Callosobruchus analis]
MAINKHIIENEKLIEEVRNYKFLYDTNDENYLKSKLKDCVWRDIAKKLDLKDGNDAKTAWMKLRNCHRDALRRQKKCMRRCVPPSAIKMWRYQKQMNFLLPFMANRSQEGNVDADSDIDDNEENSQDWQIQEAEDLEQQVLDYTNTTQQTITETTESNQSQGWSSTSNIKNIIKSSLTEDPSLSPKRRKKKAKKIKKEDTFASTNRSPSDCENVDEERIYEIKELEECSKPLDDHLYHFFMSMYHITKKMPFAYQFAVRNDVYNVVTTTEAKCFGFQSYQHQPRPTSSSYLYGRAESPHAYASCSSAPSPIKTCDNKNQPELGQEFLTVLLENDEDVAQTQSPRDNSDNFID